MKHVFYVNLRHLPYQTFINTLFYLMFHNKSGFKENKSYVQNCDILHQIRVKFVEYDFKLKLFIILYQKQKFHDSPKIADFFEKYDIFPKKCLNL